MNMISKNFGYYRVATSISDHFPAFILKTVILLGILEHSSSRAISKSQIVFSWFAVVKFVSGGCPMHTFIGLGSRDFAD